MGFHFYVKSIVAVSVLMALVWLTWYKTTEVVREVVDFQTQHYQEPKGKQSKSKLDEIHRNSDNGINVERPNKNEKDATDSVTTDFVSSATRATTTAGSTYTTTVTTPTPQKANKKDLSTYSQTTITTTLQPTERKDVHDVLDGGSWSGEKRHVAFLKVHKTGSSTVQNIFLRFGDSRNLTFILAHDNVSLAETSYPNVISYKNTLTDKNVAPPPEGRHFEILCCHVIYNRTQFQKFLPKDTAYIGLVREPVARLESSFRYFNMYPSANLSEFAANPFHYDKGAHSMSNNRMAFEFGFPLCLFPNSKEKPENLQQAIDEYVAKVMNEFDLIMINERMDESLVLLKRVLKWHTKDIMYMKQLVAKHETRRFAEGDIKNLKSHLYLDFALYEAALTDYIKRIESLGDDFQEEVKHFVEEKQKIHNFCRNKTVGMLSFPESKWDSAYSITKQDCYLYTRFEIKYIQDIRLKMYGKLDI